MNHQKQLDLLASFPWKQYPKILPNQKEALEIIEGVGGSVTLELPTGTGKTAVGYTILKALEKQGVGPLFYIVPTKTLVDQVKHLHPDTQIAYGRSEHNCLYYPDQELKANEIPCSLLVDCPHRVDQETGETFEGGAVPCPYLLQKYQAKQSRIVVCTISFYLFTQLFSKEWEVPAVLIIDEAHQLAKVIRNSLSYEITDYHLHQAVEFLKEIGANEAEHLENFLKTMTRIVRHRPALTAVLLEAHEIRELMEHLIKINPNDLRETIRKSTKGRLDTGARREVLKKLEEITFDLNRYLRSLEFSLSTPVRQPLNYTYAFYRKELSGKEKAQYRLVIRSYHVAPIIKRILSPFTVAYSATIGDANVFGFETGINAPWYSLKSDFPVQNTCVFMPLDTPNLATNNRIHQEPTKVLRRIAKACKRFSRVDLRSLVVVISDAERRKFLALAEEERVKVVSYGNGDAPKEAVARFKDGEGDVLVGTAANFGEGIDLPRRIAPVIFFLRPGYPNPKEPATIFEERRFGGRRWSLWNWRVMIEALQVRGRNIRSADDLGVTFFISQQFRRFLFASLPEWLKDAYHGQDTFDRCVVETLKMLR